MGNVCSISIPLHDGVSRCCGCITGQANYVCKLEENFHTLRTAVEELTALKSDVKTRVTVAEGEQLKPLVQVQHWISRVEATEIEVDEVIKGGTEEIEKLCIGGCCSKNFKSSYKFGKKVAKKLEDVTTLKSKGVFEVVADRVPSAAVDPRPSEATVGMESMFDKVWSCLRDEQVGIVGLFGLGGVGKTTLLNQINNQFLNTPSDFDFVIWVVVSKDLNLEKVQDEIGKRIGFLDYNWNQKGRDEKATEIRKVMRKKKFVLLLDDIWERVDLTEIGVPLPDNVNKSKLVFTTRSKDVCGLMEAHKKIEVECLPWEKAWELFKEKVGADTLNSHPNIPTIAESVAKECGGLPLALITIGRAMACKNSPEQWKHAIGILRKYAAKFSGMQDKVFARLKFSFDNLHNNIYRYCFSYCALFPEDYLIVKDTLIDYWIIEGFLGDYEEINEARNEGYDIIGTLINACLLEEEEECVKMHDVIRDMTLWIVCENGKEKNDYFMVRAGAQLTEAPKVGKWKGAKRISLMGNQIVELSETPICPNLTTLFLNKNGLMRIPDGFCQHMPVLQVLDLSSNSDMSELPLEISKLVSLHYLNLSNTAISQLPIELRNLVNLKYLNLESTPYLTMIPRQVISSFSKLQVCKMNRCGSSDVEVEDSVLSGGNEGLVVELAGLKHLQDLNITIRSASALERYFGSNKLQCCTRDLFLEDINELSVINISFLENVKHLARLKISGYGLKELKIDKAWGEMISSKRFFQSLHEVYIDFCSKLRNLTWLVFAPNIRSLWLMWCDEMKEIICVEKLSKYPEEIANLNPFLKLESLCLSGLPVLKSIYPIALPFPYLKKIIVIKCPELKRLSLNSNSTKGCKINIEGEKEWWDKLEWQDEATQNAFLPSFKELEN